MFQCRMSLRTHTRVEASRLSLQGSWFPWILFSPPRFPLQTCWYHEVSLLVTWSLLSSGEYTNQTINWDRYIEVHDSCHHLRWLCHMGCELSYSGWGALPSVHTDCPVSSQSNPVTMSLQVHAGFLPVASIFPVLLQQQTAVALVTRIKTIAPF